MKKNVLVIFLLILMGCATSNYSINIGQGIRLIKTESLSHSIFYRYSIAPEAMWCVSKENLDKIKADTKKLVCSGKTQGRAIFHLFYDLKGNPLGNTQVIQGECGYSGGKSYKYMTGKLCQTANIKNDMLLCF